jgi:hypothetical protein
MKKILLASTALVLSAGIAQAQAVRITGEGRMGIQYDSNGLFGASNWRQENRLQMNFTVGVTGDHGLTFGAFSRVRIENGGSPISGVTRGGVFSGSRVWVEAANLRLTFGNVDGAFRGAGTSHGYVGGCGVGYEGGIQCWDTAGLLGRTQGFVSTNGGPEARARLDYTFGSTRVALSHQREGSTELGIRSTFDAFTVALGYSNRANATGTLGSTVALSGSYNGGSWSTGLLVARLKTGATTVTNWSLSGRTDLGGGNLYGYVGRVGGDRSYGLSYGYGLGGGATLTVGAERLGARTVGSVGVAFNF